MKITKPSKFNPETFFARVTSYVTNAPSNDIRIEIEEHDNGGKETIWHTGVRRYNGIGIFVHVEGSAIGHGYGEAGKKAAIARIERLLDGAWREFVDA